jgi:hypothetical protein
MAMQQIISDSDREMLRQRFEETLDRDVAIQFYSVSEARSLLTVPGEPDMPLSQLVHQLITEFTELSAKLKSTFHDFHGEGSAPAQELGITRIPVIVPGDDPQGRVRFLGTPMGNEFATILASVEALSKEDTHLSSPVAEATLKHINEPADIKVFVTRT